MRVKVSECVIRVMRGGDENYGWLQTRTDYTSPVGRASAGCGASGLYLNQRTYGGTMSILAHRLMRLIELHADTLAVTLAHKIATSERCPAYRHVCSDELKTLYGGVYGHLGQWLVSKTEEDIANLFMPIGTRRAEQGVPVSEVLWCIVLIKENLWEYLQNEDPLENTAQIFGELELVQMMDQFFDRAMYYAVRGHEKVRDTQLAELKK
jgi:hypothetical protein